jgi:hypothetical protein
MGFAWVCLVGAALVLAVQEWKTVALIAAIMALGFIAAAALVVREAGHLCHCADQGLYTVGRSLAAYCRLRLANDSQGEYNALRK